VIFTGKYSSYYYPLIANSGYVSPKAHNLRENSRRVNFPKGFDLEKSIFYASLVDIAYTAYHEGDEVARKKIPKGFEVLDFFDIKDEKPDEMGYVLRKENEVFIPIRGTSNFSEWMDDFDAVQIDYPYARKSFFPWRRIKVHRGFLDSYRSFRDGLLRGVRKLEGVDTVYVLGHSLGAAITTLCALDISKFQNVVMYNYASPFVGNERFVKYYTSFVKRSYRIQNDKDIVPKVPPEIMGYKHIDSGIVLTGPDTINLEEQHSLHTYINLLQKLK